MLKTKVFRFFKITRDMLWKATVPSDNPNDSDVLPMFAKFAFWLFEFALAFLSILMISSYYFFQKSYLSFLMDELALLLHLCY